MVLWWCCGCVVCGVVKLGTLSLLLSLLPFLFPFLFLSSFSFSCSFSFSSLSLLFSPPNTMERTDQPTRRPTSRHLNVIWRRASAQQSVLSLLFYPPSSLLSLSSSKKKRRLLLQEYFRRRIYFYNSFLKKFPKIAAGENYSHYSFKLIQKQKGCNYNDFVKDGTYSLQGARSSSHERCPRIKLSAVGGRGEEGQPAQTKPNKSRRSTARRNVFGLQVS